MPTSWYSWHGIDKDSLNEKFSLYKEIVAEKKPYFMVYIYPSLMRQYNTYIKGAERNAARRYDKCVDELVNTPTSSLDDDELEFVRNYRRFMPVGTGKCVMNTICGRFEDEFNGYLSRKREEVAFDQSILKGDSDYSQAHYNAINYAMREYNRKLQDYSIVADYNRVDVPYADVGMISVLDDWFREQCVCICPDADELCNIVIDLCYSKEKTKQFAWRMCGESIVQNVLNKNGYVINYPTKDDDGDILWKSGRYVIKTSRVRCKDDYFE